MRAYVHERMSLLQDHFMYQAWQSFTEIHEQTHMNVVAAPNVTRLFHVLILARIFSSEIFVLLKSLHKRNKIICKSNKRVFPVQNAQKREEAQ
jgi:hypothetical protein